jgi:hypothetical protein
MMGIVVNSLLENISAIASFIKVRASNDVPQIEENLIAFKAIWL